MVSGAFVSAIVLSISPFRKSVYGQKVLEQGWEVVENDISGQNGYEKTDTVPVVMIAEK